jgi:iron complex outermembrane receptor protein
VESDNASGTTCGETPPPPPPDGGTGTLKGTVTDNFGNKLGDVLVLVSDPGGHSDSSNKGGKYSIQDVSAGTWTVTATLSGFVDGVAEVPITAGTTSTVNFILSQ